MTQGHQLFADALAALAAQIGDPRLSAIAGGITEPLHVAVHGRRGVGRRTVAAALTATGLRLSPGRTATADLVVYVVAEVLKPEDSAALGALRGHPVLVVLNKADVSRDCGVTAIRTTTGLPTEPMSALFALAACGDRFDQGMWESVRRLAEAPADLRSAEHFVRCEHPLTPQAREQLCDTVAISGITRLLDVARHGGTAAQARALLRRDSGVGAVIARVAAMSAGVYHRRMSEVVTRLEALAVVDGRIDDFLVGDAAVDARLIAAEAAVGVSEEPGLARARRWQGYRSAPLAEAQRACAADIARGSLRAWAAAGSRR